MLSKSKGNLKLLSSKLDIARRPILMDYCVFGHLYSTVTWQPDLSVLERKENNNFS